VLEEMTRTGSSLGGEQSGHIIFSELSPTGDGIISSLEFLNALVRSNYDIDSIYGLVSRFPQKLRNIRVADKKSVMESEEIREKVLEMEGFMGGNGRIVLRPSGTEPLIRVMVEAEDMKMVDYVIEEFTRLIEDGRQ